MFRGLAFDMKLADVKQSETVRPDVEYEDYLRYRLFADSIASGESVDMEYFFNKNNQLDLMIAFYNLADEDDLHPLADELRRYFERSYGRARLDEQGWYHWQFDDKKGESGSIEVNLVGETEKGYMGVEIEMIKYYENEERLR